MSHFLKLTAARIAATKDGKVRKTKPVIDSKDCFRENSPSKGFCSKEHFMEYLSLLTEEEMRDLDLFFTYLSENRRLDFGRGLRFDRFGTPYYWVTVQNGRITQGLKLVAFDGLEKLIEINRQYDFNITLDGLTEQLEDCHSDNSEKDDSPLEN